MATWRVNNSTTLGGEICSQWQANHAYSLGARCVSTLGFTPGERRALVFECTTAGTSHAATEPTWPTSGTIADGAGTLVWTVRSPDDGTWNNASCFLQYITNYAANLNGGDTILVDDGHSETGCNFPTLLGAKSYSNPTRILCVNKADDSLSTGALVTSGVGWNVALQFNYSGYSYGVCYAKGGLGLIVDGSQLYTNTEPCQWVLESSGPTVNVFVGTEVVVPSHIVAASGNHPSWFDAASLTIKNAGISLDTVGAYLAASTATLNLENVKLTAAAEISALFKNCYTGKISLRCVDISAMCTGATSRYLINHSDIIGRDSTIDLIRCKLPSGAGFSIITGTPTGIFGQTRIRLHHCSKNNCTYDFAEANIYGSVEDEATIVRTGGAANGTIPISCKAISTAYTLENFVWFELTKIHGWTNAITSKTFTIELVYDSVTALQNDEIWMELEYPANASDGLGAIASSKCALLGTPANLSTSAKAWTTTGLTNPNKFKMSVTVTPGKAGPITARVCIAKPSTTIYIDPMITES